MRATITVLAAVNTDDQDEIYTVTHRDECRRGTHRHAYDMAASMGCAVTVGAIVCEPHGVHDGEPCEVAALTSSGLYYTHEMRAAVVGRVKLAIVAAQRGLGLDGDAATQGAALVAVDCAFDAARYALDGNIEMAEKHAVFSLQAARDAGVDL